MGDSMNWQNVKLILGRELKDQLRDRRTLFTVLVLPLLLYPLMGMAFLQISQFARNHSSRIWIAGHENLPKQPPLIRDGQFVSELLAAAKTTNTELLIAEEPDRILTFFKKLADTPDGDPAEQVIQQVMQEVLVKNKADLAIIIPDPIEVASLSDRENETPIPKLHVFRNSSRDKSNIASDQFRKLVTHWKSKVSLQTLESRGIDVQQLESFQTVHKDVADHQWKQAATWSKILPFIVMIWCLTGAFYPAVDLCAGEKERGTFETLLSSPALRNEIAFGKLLTVITFSITTAVLNLLSMGFTGLFVVSRLGSQLGADSAMMTPLGLPPINSFFWLLIALIPIASLFSAVALAAASFAKSSKEGQYYLVPLMMISMPLMMLPMMPAAKLDLGTSLIPVSGLMLMLRGLIEGQYAQVAPYAGPVVGVTLVCCWLAIRWVVIQFNSESVIFRPSERFSVGVWLKQSIQERHELPLAGHALLCGLLILVLKFFVSLGASSPDSWLQFSKQTVVMLLASVAVPAVLMAMFLTRKPATTLKLKLCSLPVACAAVLAAIGLHPTFMALTNLVMTVYPPSADLTLLQGFIGSLLADAPGFVAILLVLAVVPAVFEELAFRGFILSGLQSWRSDFKAIVISSLFFGLAHSILQQSIVTFFVGCVLGFLAVRTSSLIPCVLYHLVHNGISTSLSLVNENSINQYPLLGYLLVQSNEGGFEYTIAASVGLSLMGFALLIWFFKNQTVDDQIPESAQTELGVVLERFVKKIGVNR